MVEAHNALPVLRQALQTSTAVFGNTSAAQAPAMRTMRPSPPCEAFRLTPQVPPVQDVGSPPGSETLASWLGRHTSTSMSFSGSFGSKNSHFRSGSCQKQSSLADLDSLEKAWLSEACPRSALAGAVNKASPWRARAP